MSVTVRVPAKVNVQLAVGAARPDGFHDLANVFLAVGLYDEVTVTPAGRLRITCAGPDADQVPLDPTNLAARAAIALAGRHGIDPDVHLHIAKDIPVAGGMAGGSADAAGALLACDALWGTGASRGGTARHLRRVGQRRAVQPGRRGGARHRPGRAADPAGGRRHLPLGVRGRRRRAVHPGRLPGVRPAARAGTDVPEPEGLAGRCSTPCATGDADGARRGRSPTTSSPPRSPCSPRSPTPSPPAPGAGALAALVSGSGPTTAFLAADAEAADASPDALRASGTCRTARVTDGVPGAG